MVRKGRQPGSDPRSVCRAAIDERIRLVVDGDVIRARGGTPSDSLRALITADRDGLMRYLSNQCGRCGNPAYLITYWGERLCEPCVPHVVAEFDDKDAWPEWPIKERA